MTELISKNIRAQRLAQGMTQEQLAAKVFTTRQCISNYETGKSKPDYETIGKIAMAPGISAEELLYDASERRKKVRAWCILAAIIFFFGLARSLCHSNLLISNATMPGRLTYVQGYITVIIPATCTFFGWILIRLYELYIKKEDCTLNRTKRVSIFLILLLGSWFLAAFMELPKIYEAASDPMTNKYGCHLQKRRTGLKQFVFGFIFSLMSIWGREGEQSPPHPQHLMVCLLRIFGAGIHHVGFSE